MSTAHKPRLRTIALVGGALALSAGTAHATDGYFLNGIGAKAKGAGGAAIANPQDALAIASNPAAATELGHRLDAGVEIFVPDRGASIGGNDLGGGASLDGTYSGNGSNPFILPEIAYVRPLSDRVAVGIAINGNGGMNTAYKTNPFASLGATGTAGVDLKQISITPTVAVRIAPRHSLGVSPIAVIQGFRVSGIQPFAGASADEDRFSNQGTDWAFGAGVRVGYLGHFGERVRIGAFYQSKVWSGRFKKYAGLFADRGDFDVPASWGAGIAVRPVPALTLATDVKRIEYSGVGSVGNPLGRLSPTVPFGAAGGPGFGWRDVTVVKVGAIYDLGPRWTVRAGYGYSDNPVPASETLLNVLAPGVVQHHITAGATWTAPSGLELTGYIMHAPKNTVRGSGSIPDSFGGGEANVRLSETAVGLSAGVKF